MSHFAEIDANGTVLRVIGLALLVVMLASCATDLTPQGARDYCERNPQTAECGGEKK